MPNSRGSVFAAPITVSNGVGNSTQRAGSAEAGKTQRIAPLDFTKGILVLVMVLYHWLNYFVTGHDWVYKYLRFLPISFTFISGFLISQVYLSKYERVDLKVPKRLFIRGLKLLAIVAVLNLAPRMLHFQTLRMRASNWSFTAFAWDYLLGEHAIAFSVLVPIAYLLILSSGIFLVSKHWKNAYHVTCLVLVLGAIACEVGKINGGYVQTVSIGMLGVSIGHISMDQINRLLIHGRLIFLAYVGYLFAIMIWNDSYVLQIVGVCVTLLFIYWCGTLIVERHGSGKIAILLGQYSLFSYIIQIVILQILRGGLRAFTTEIGASIAAFLACIGCTILSVVVLDNSRRRAPAINTLYKAVFS
jgi:peptidoglycan/LPS O-acetylase OafA/YrhL